MIVFPIARVFPPLSLKMVGLSLISMLLIACQPVIININIDPSLAEDASTVDEEVTGLVASKDARIQAWLRNSLSPTEEVIATRYSTSEVIGREFVRAKIVDNTSGKVREIIIDVANGNYLAYDALRSEALSAWRQQNSAASPALVRYLSEALSTAYLVDVELITDKQIEDMRLELEAREIEVISTHRRVMTVRGTANQIRTITLMPYVSTVTPHYRRENLSLNAAQDLAEPPLAIAHSIGIGVGWPTAIWELDACIFRSHHDFSHINWEPRFGNADCNVSAQAGHSTQVAGALGASRGTSETAGLFRGGFFDVDATDANAEDDMWARRPLFVNASFTITPFDAIEIDRAVYENGTFVFNGSGNDPGDEANCYAYNALCVGGYSHESTIGQYSDDTIWPGSFINDRNNGREYPDVLGPATVRTASNRLGGYTMVTGTSFATPAVAGLGALLLTNYPFVLFEKPALMRAVLMASAQAHPILDDTRRRIPDATDDIDDRMGVGVPNGLRAKSIMDEKTFIFKRITPTTLGLQTSFEVEAEERVRVVLTWDQCPGYSFFDPGGAQLTADLDLAIQAPSNLNPPGQIVTYTNVSFVDNKEVVEFITQAAGTVNVLVSAEHFATCEAEGNIAVAPMAIAWTKEPAPPIFINPNVDH